jgi:K+-sensing histidine kinase KdpD
MRRTRLPAPPLSSGFGYPLGAVTAALATMVAVAAGATTHPHRALVTLIAVTAVTAAATTLRASLATAAVCWALHTGFVLNRHGELQFNAASTRTAALLAATALISFALAATARSTAGQRSAWTRRTRAWLGMLTKDSQAPRLEDRLLARLLEQNGKET